MSTSAARRLVRDILLRFSCQLLMDKHLGQEDLPADMDNKLDGKALILSQQLLYSACSIKTPFSIGTAFDIYNTTCSKTQMGILDRLNQNITYDTFHHQLTSVYNDAVNKVQENGLYIPPHMDHGVFTQFAMDNIDWHEKTQDGSTFHATSSIMIQPPKSNEDNTLQQPQENTVDHQPEQTCSMPVSRKKTITQVHSIPIDACRITQAQRKASRSLENLSMEDILVEGGTHGQQLLISWQLGRLNKKRILDIDIDNSMVMPGFNAFCANLSNKSKANEIGYLPLLPSSPTDPGVVKTAMADLVKAAEAIGMKHTIITCDQRNI